MSKLGRSKAYSEKDDYQLTLPSSIKDEPWRGWTSKEVKAVLTAKLGEDRKPENETDILISIEQKPVSRGGAVAGIAIGSVFGFAILLCAIILIYRRFRSRYDDEDDYDDEDTHKTEPLLPPESLSDEARSELEYQALRGTSIPDRSKVLGTYALRQQEFEVATPDFVYYAETQYEGID